MRRVEQVKVISAKSEAKLEEAYNKWYVQLADAREQVPAIRGQSLVIHERHLTVHGSGAGRTLFLSVFYEHLLFQEQEVGSDRGVYLDTTGVSAVNPRGGRSGRR